MLKLRFLLTVSLTAAALLGSGATAQASFSPPQTVAGGAFAYHSKVLASGSAIVWSTFEGIQGSRISHDFTLSPPALLSAPTGPKVPDYAGSPLGDVLVVDRSDAADPAATITVGHLSAGDSSVHTIASPGRVLNDPSAAFAGVRRNGAVAYSSEPTSGGVQRVVLTRLAADGTPGRTSVVGPGFLPELALSARERAAVAWYASEGIRGAPVSRTGKAGTVVSLARGDAQLDEVAWGSGSSPLALITGPRSRGKPTTLRVTRFGGRSTKSWRIAASGGISEAQLEVDAIGRAWISWLEFSGSDQVFRARRLSRSGKLTKPITLSSPKVASFDPELTLAQRGGTPGVVWRTEGEGGKAVRFGRIRQGAVKAQTVASDGRFFDPSLSFDDSGRAIVSWTQIGGGEDEVRLARELRR